MTGIKYLIVSWENQGIFTIETDPVIANGLASSNLNCYVRDLFEFNFPNLAEIKDRDQFKNNYYKLDSKSYELQPLLPHLINDSWLAEQEAMFLRQDALIYLRYNARLAMTGMERNVWSNFSIEAEIELDKCKPDEGIYTRPLEEYARIMNQPVEQTYKELKLTVEGEKFVRFRVAALTKFFQIKINNIKTKDDFYFIQKYIMHEFWNKSHI